MDNKEPNFQMSFAFIDRQIDGNIIQQRMLDGYINATALCKAAGKRMYDYLRLENTKAFIFALESKTGIPASALIQAVKGGNVELQGTWVHPYVCLLYTSPSPRDLSTSRMPSSA